MRPWPSGGGASCFGTGAGAGPNPLSNDDLGLERCPRITGRGDRLHPGRGQSGLPHTLTWVRSNCQSGGAFCTGAAYSETVWDLMTRDLPAVYGMDRNTAMEVTRRLFLTIVAGLACFALLGVLS